MLQSIENTSSYVQCKWLNVWSTLTHFLAKTIFFQRVWEVYKIVVEIPEGLGGGGYFSSPKKGNPGEKGGLM